MNIDKIDGTNVTYDELQKALKERELQKLVEKAEKEMAERNISADELVAEMKKDKEAELQKEKERERERQKAEEERQKAEEERLKKLAFQEKMNKLDKECRTTLPFINGEEYFKIGDNYWNTKKYTIEQAYELSQTLNSCKFCIDSSNLAFCEYCVNCYCCNNCHYCANSVGCYFSYMLQRCRYCSFCRILTSCDGCVFCMLCTFCSRCKNCYDETYSFYKAEAFYPILFSIDSFYGTEYIFPLTPDSDDAKKKKHLLWDEFKSTPFIQRIKSRIINHCS